MADRPADQSLFIRVAMHSPFTGTIDSKKPAIKQCMLGRYIGDNDDVIKRINHLKNQMDSAVQIINSENGGQANSQNSLTIFMAPEWFFRPTMGAYSENDLSIIVETIRDISVLPGYENMLIVPGSILWGEKQSGIVKKGKTFIFNAAPVIMAGKLLCLTHKSLNIGDVGNQSTERWGLDHLSMEVISERMRTLFNQQDPKTDGLFDVQLGETILKFGLEICGDHNNQRLKKQFAFGPDVDIHLVIGSGQVVSKLNMAAKSYGISCDGGNGFPQELATVLAVNHKKNHPNVSNNEWDRIYASLKRTLIEGTESNYEMDDNSFQTQYEKYLLAQQKRINGDNRILKVMGVSVKGNNWTCEAQQFQDRPVYYTKHIDDDGKDLITFGSEFANQISIFNPFEIERPERIHASVGKFKSLVEVS